MSVFEGGARLLGFDGAAESRPSLVPAAGHPWSPARCHRSREHSDAADPIGPARRVAGRFRLSRHHQRAQLGVGRWHAMVRAARVHSLREAKLRGHQTNQVQTRSWHQRCQPLHELQHLDECCCPVSAAPVHAVLHRLHGIKIAVCGATGIRHRATVNRPRRAGFRKESSILDAGS